MGETLNGGPVPAPPPEYRWYHKLSAVLLITFCMEIGFFLVIFPWTEFWEANYFSSVIPEWRQHCAANPCHPSHRVFPVAARRPLRR